MQRQHRDPAVGLLCIGFSPANRLAAIVRSKGWESPVLADEGRELYSALGIGRAPWWRVYSPGTLVTYARSGLGQSRQRPSQPVEDTRQLSGDAVVVDGVAVSWWRPRSPDDRPAAEDVLAEASRLARPQP